MKSRHKFLTRGDVVVLRRQAGVAQIAWFAVVVVEAAIVEVAVLGVDDERNDAVAQAFAEEEEAADAAVAVLERVDALEADMEREERVEVDGTCGVTFEQLRHGVWHVFRRGRFAVANDVCNGLVFADAEVREIGV